MYCDYWNINKAPFDNVPDPTMYAACHTSMENAISETIFAIKEADESFAVIISEAGLGKTLALRLIINALEPEKFRSVLITNPSLSFTQLLREIIVQITGKPCEEVQKGVLLDMLRHMLAASMDQGKKIVIFIDEANALTPANLEDMRLLTNIQDEKRNLLTLVLAGQLELAQHLEHPQQANLFQRIGSYALIGKLPSKEAVKTYIESRLKLAGTNIRIFADECIPVIWEYSEHGVPRLINKICKLCLKAGETNQFDYISADLVANVAGRFQKLTDTASAHIPPSHSTPVILQEESERPAKAEENEAPAEATVAETVEESSEIETSFEDDSALNIAGEETGKLIQFPVAVNNKTSEDNMPVDTGDIRIEAPETAIESMSDDDLLKQWEKAISSPSETAVIAAIMEQELELPTSETSISPKESMTERNDSPVEKDLPLSEMPELAQDEFIETADEPPVQVTPPEPAQDEFIEAAVEPPAQVTPPELAQDEFIEAAVEPPAQVTPPELAQDEFIEAAVEPPAQVTPPELAQDEFIEAAVEPPAQVTPPEPAQDEFIEAAVEPPAQVTPPEPAQDKLIEAAVEPPAQVTPPEPAQDKLIEAVDEPPVQITPEETPKDADNDIIMIGEYRVKLGIPNDILKQVKSFNRESANKSAGFWAAQIIKNNPQLTRSAQADPVQLWNEIKDNILKKIAV